MPMKSQGEELGGLYHSCHQQMLNWKQRLLKMLQEIQIGPTNFGNKAKEKIKEATFAPPKISLNHWHY